jgi:hypothetical protein
MYRVSLFAMATYFCFGLVPARAQHLLDLTKGQSGAEHPGQSIGSVKAPGHSGALANQDLTIQLLRLDRNAYILGERVVFEVQLVNASRQNVEIPWSAERKADIEPKRMAHVGLVVRSSPRSTRQLASISLFEWPDDSNSILRLRPGETATIRAAGIIAMNPERAEQFLASEFRTVLVYARLIMPMHVGDMTTAIQSLIPFPTKLKLAERTLAR